MRRKMENEILRMKKGSCGNFRKVPDFKEKLGNMAEKRQPIDFNLFIFGHDQHAIKEIIHGGTQQGEIFQGEGVVSAIDLFLGFLANRLQGFEKLPLDGALEEVGIACPSG